MRLLLMGTTGCGKTLTAVRIAQFIHQNFGYKIYSNVELFNLPYTHLNNSNPLKDIKFNEKSVIIIDEIGISVRGNTIHSQSFSDLLAQSRKRFKTEKSWLIMTAQIVEQIPLQVAELIDEIWTIQNDTVDGRPYKLGGNIPFAVKYERKVYIPKYMSFVVYPKMRWISGLHHAINSYDTFRETRKFVTTQLEEFAERYSEFIGEKKMRGELEDILVEVEGLSIAEAKRTARKIINYDLLKKYREEQENNI